MWPVAFTLKQLTAAAEAKIDAPMKRAVRSGCFPGLVCLGRFSAHRFLLVVHLQRPRLPPQAGERTPQRDEPGAHPSSCLVRKFCGNDLIDKN
jgi:hypothetical protein